MMTSKIKKGLIVFAVGSVIATSLAYQNCSGTRSRSADFSISLADVNTKLDAFEAKVKAGGDAPSIAEVAAFKEIASRPSATLYYSEAPGSLGSIAQALPMDFSIFDPQNKIGTPTKVIAFVVVDHSASDWHGAVILTGNSGAASTAAVDSSTTGTTLPGATAAPGANPTPNATPAPVADDFSFALIGVNSGTQSLAATGGTNLQVGTLDSALRIPVSINGVKPAVLATDDVKDGDLVDGPIQFELLVDDGNGGESSAGILNVVTPQN